ncbi:MAG: hypothetical protein AAF597_00980 [Bacteroidota bacterium]
MKNLSLLLVLCVSTSLTAQEETPAFFAEDFEAQVLTYKPRHRAGIAEKAYDFGAMVLRETVSQTGNDPAAFNRADYFNVLTAFLSLGENTESIDLAFQKFRNSEGSCEYFLSESFPVETKETYLPIRERWHDAAMDCRVDAGEAAVPTDPKAYALAHDLDTDLVFLMAQISKWDQCFRSPTYQPEKQTPLDRKNEWIIDSLHQRYGTYIGTKLVGEAYAHTMWSVIQHSRLPTMERYLPVVHLAVVEEDLPAAPLKMLIDRVYTGKTGKQIFGSQAGVELLPKTKCAEIRKQYGL